MDSKAEDKDKVLEKLNAAVYAESKPAPEDAVPIKGYDFNKGLDYEAVFKSYLSTGFQATALGQAIDTINAMIKWRLSDEPIAEDEAEDYRDEEVRKNTRCSIFLGYTSNMASCGMREYIRYLCQHKMVTAIVTTTGGIEEDIMKLFADHFLGEFHLDGEKLRKMGYNRIGNLIVPNANYTHLEEWFKPLVVELHEEQKASGNQTYFSPSQIIYRIG